MVLGSARLALLGRDAMDWRARARDGLPAALVAARLEFLGSYLAPQFVPVWGWCETHQRYEPLATADDIKAFNARF